MEFCTASGAADGVEFKRQILHTQAVKNRFCQADYFCICNRSFCAEHFYTKLVEFTQTACLRLFIAIAGSQVIQLNRKAFVVQCMLQHCTDSARGSFGTKGDGTAAFIIKGIHLFFYHVGGIAHAAQEQLGMLKHGRTDLAKTMNCSFAAHHVFNDLPVAALRREKILCALGRLC